MESADFYTGIVAQVYGALRSTTFSAARYRAFIDSHGQPALELGCGDDGPFYELASDLDIDGVDSSADMVRAGRERLRAAGSSARVHQQRMEELSLPRAYSSIYLAGPTFNLLVDDATALEALRRIARHLLPGGAALIPLWMPPPTPTEEFGVTRIGRVGSAEARYTVVGEDYDGSSRTRTTHTRYELVSGTDHVVEHRDWIIHWFTPDGFRLLAQDAGLSVEPSAVEDDEFTAVVRVREPIDARRGSV